MCNFIIHLLPTFFSLLSAGLWLYAATIRFKGAIIGIIGGYISSGLENSIGGGKAVPIIGLDELNEVMLKQSRFNSFAAIAMAVSIVLSLVIH